MGLEELGFGEKVKMIKVIDWLCFDRLDTLNRPWPIIFIGWGGLIPQEVLFIDKNLLNNLITLGFLEDRSDRSILSVRPFGCCRTDYSVGPVRPLGRTGQTGRYCLVPILVVNICLPVFWQSLRANDYSSGPKLSKSDEYIGHFLC